MSRELRLVRHVLVFALGSAFALSGVAVAANQPDAAINPDLAASECGLGDAVVIDATQIAVPSVLAAQIAGIRERPVVIAGGLFEGTDFTPVASQFAGACFYRTQLSKTSWAGATATGITFTKADLSGANFRNAQLDRARFIGVDAREADFSSAVLNDGHWQGAFWTANLAKARFAGADMKRFQFSCGITMDESCGGSSGADFRGADLTASDLSEFPIWGFDDFSQARLGGATLSASAVPHIGSVQIDTAISLATGDPGNPVTLSAGDFGVLKKSSENETRDVPSFDCNSATSDAEALICGPYETHLRSRDQDLAFLYSAAKQRGQTTVKEQRAWMRGRDRCTERQCLIQAYDDRITTLFARTNTAAVLAPDEQWAFAQDVVPVSPEMRRSALYASVRPALDWASMQSIRITGLEDGSLHAEGDAVGANAHTCSFSVPVARYDRDTGWYVAQGEGGAIPVFRLWGDRLMPRYSGNADTPIEAMDFISCGARAGFAELRRLPDPELAP